MDKRDTAIKTQEAALNAFFDAKMAAARNPECTTSARNAKEATRKLAELLVDQQEHA